MPHRITENCITCNACSSECPQGAIVAGGGHAISRIDPEKCTDCGTCTTLFFCPVGAIEEEQEPSGRDGREERVSGTADRR